MLKFIKILMDEKKEGDGGGAPAPKEQPEQEPELDDLGYEVPKKPEDEKPAPKPEPKADEKEPKVPATGYGEDPPPAPKEPDPKKDDEKPADPEEEDELKLDLKDLDVNDAKEIKEFAKKHKLSKEAAQALVDREKAEIKKAKDFLTSQSAERERQKQAQRRQWHDELKADPNFGGEKFAHNISRAERVVEEFLPNLKKQLTESKGMVPPYVMRDLAKLADHLYSSEKLTQGSPPAKKVEEKENDDALGFYE